MLKMKRSSTVCYCSDCRTFVFNFVSFTDGG